LDPAQINYLTYGNSVPHVHTYLLPRYLDDPCPGLPLQPFIERAVAVDALSRQCDQLVHALEATAPEIYQAHLLRGR
jgi:diadenosine tetraphosphate (Ap4A) HIT family hydrolase